MARIAACGQDGVAGNIPATGGDGLYGPDGHRDSPSANSGNGVITITITITITSTSTSTIVIRKSRGRRLGK